MFFIFFTILPVMNNFLTHIDINVEKFNSSFRIYSSQCSLSSILSFFYFNYIFINLFHLLIMIITLFFSFNSFSPSVFFAFYISLNNFILIPLLLFFYPRLPSIFLCYFDESLTPNFAFAFFFSLQFIFFLPRHTQYIIDL